MTRWFRFYDEALNDPKILKLSDNLYRIWVGLLCVASKNDGQIPPLEDLALMMRIKPEKMHAALTSLIKSGLIDDDGSMLSPHNWAGRQYKSDTSNDRVKRYRERKRNVTVTPPDTEQSQTTDTEKERGSADAPDDKVVPLRRYAFEGRMIRLDQQAYDRWVKVYHAIHDLPATLQAADDYYSENPPKGGKWFFPVSRWLEKQHTQEFERAAAIRREARTF